ncbi:MAG: putrescine ABC transporter permease PotH [Holosporales bacterium]|jgi:putrescine transport system permease protein|nr:putrescine ABC transporter permease PotH [Holosporales bacterium]
MKKADVLALVLKTIKSSMLYKSLKNKKFFLALLPFVWLVLFCAIPFSMVFRMSFTSAVFGIPPYSEIFQWSSDNIIKIAFNIQNYLVVIKDSYYIESFINSVILSIITVFACSTLGLIMAYGIFCVSAHLRPTLLLLISLSFWTSFLIRVYSWINMLSAHGIVNNFLIKIGLIDEPIKFIGNYYIVCIGFIFCYLPLMILPIYASLEKIDKSCVESAWNLGCGIYKTFWTLIIPMSISGLKTGCLLVGTASLAEFVIPELLGGPDSLTFGRVLWTEFFTNLDWPMTCSLSVSMIVVFSAFFLLCKEEKIRQ